MQETQQRLRLTIEGMSCHHCTRAVWEALEKLAGVVVHDVQIGSAEITLNPEKTSLVEIASALEEEGYRLVEGESG